MVSTQKKTDRYSLAQAKYGPMIDNDTLNVPETNLGPGLSTPPASNSYTIRSSEYYLEKLSNGKIYCKIYMIVGMIIAPSSLTSDLNKYVQYDFTVNLPITLSKVKYCNWVHYDTSLTSFIIASLAPNRNYIHVFTIHKVPLSSEYLTTGEKNDILITVEGTI